METIARINGVVNGFVWGPVMLCFYVGIGVFFTLWLGFPQLRYFIQSWKTVLGITKQKVDKNEPSDGKSISSFAAMATAMAATVGTGNIAGVATAMHLGGPGAVVWMLVSAFFGMTTKFAEVALAVHYREKDPAGSWRGGTMYILEKGTGHKWLAIVFAFLTFIASFGIGCAVQSNSAAAGFEMAFGIQPLHSGVILAVAAALVLVGGLTSLAKVTTLLVPFMSAFYILGSLVIIFQNASALPGAIATAFGSAFGDPMAFTGAIAGWTVKEAVSRGIARGVFTNEAGMGSAPMAHATARTDHPVRQGMYGIFEVFADTFMVCTMTAVVILATETLTGRPDLNGAQLTLAAFEAGMGELGKIVMSIGLVLFAFSTILGWYWYSETAAVYLFGLKFRIVGKALWVIFILIGAAGSTLFGSSGNEFLALLWDVADTLNGLMALPNLVGMLLLAGVVRKLVKDFDAKRKNGELP